MEHTNLKDVIKVDMSAKLSDSEDYYNNVFKKTERIISAVLYILSFIPDSERQSLVYKRMYDSLYKVHDTSLASLFFQQVEAPTKLFSLQHSLLSFESNLRLAIASRLLPQSVASSVEEELDSVMRYIKNHFLGKTSGDSLRSVPRAPALGSTAQARTSRTRRVRPNIPANDLSSDAVMVYSDLNDRAVRIKTVLEATPNATIKDLSDVITDVSSKTIQRELNSLIEKGEVIREGERRWSTYNITK